MAASRCQPLWRFRGDSLCFWFIAWRLRGVSLCGGFAVSAFVFGGFAVSAFVFGLSLDNRLPDL
jgi:hypothetical protein